MTMDNPIPPANPVEKPGGSGVAPTNKHLPDLNAEIPSNNPAELYRALVNSSPDGILITDLETRISFASQAILMAFELENQDQILGTTVNDWVDPEDFQRHRNDIANAVQGNFAKYSVYHFHTSKGSHFVGEINAALLLDGSGKPSGFIGSIRDVTLRIQTEEALQRVHQELVDAYSATLEGWVYALDLRDNETEHHTRRVTDLTTRLASAMGFPPGELIDLKRGVLLHDIGKIGIPDRILNKPGALTAEEWSIMRRHPDLAHQMLHPIHYLQGAIDIPYCHHERWDGSGYPRGIKGEEIPLAARIFAVVDVWDALTSDRPYRKACSREEANQYLVENAGKLFDPQVVESFLRLLES